MKKCPFCKADIQDNAKFCLYCMTSLNEKRIIKTKTVKNKRWLSILAALLCFLLIGVCVFGILSEYNQTEKITKLFSTEKEATIAKSESDANKVEATNTPDKTENNLNPDTSSQTNNSKPKQTDTNEVPTNAGEKTDKTQNKTNQASVITSASQNQQNTTSITKAVVSNVTYVYRAAKQGDDFSVSYPIENCVVITDVTTKSSDGVYVIPEKLGGKNVIAIMGGAFCNSNVSSSVKKVVVPSTVKTIWNYAFSSCYNLSDIYFKGSSIYTEANAFANKSSRNVTLTIHCSADCSDRNFRYYKNSADDYDAKYKEWNGGAYN